MAALLGAVLVLVTSPSRVCASGQQVRFAFVAPEEKLGDRLGQESYESRDFPDGFRGVWITPGNEKAFLALAPPNLARTFREMQPGQTLRRWVDEVLAITGGSVDVDYHLVDDRTSLTVDRDPGIYVTDRLSGNLAVWPATWTWPKGARHRALVTLGERASGHIQKEPGQWLAWQGAIVHETAHTLFVHARPRAPILTAHYAGYPRDPEDPSKWGLIELWDDPDTAFEMAVCKWFGRKNNPAALDAVETYFERRDVRYVVAEGSTLAASIAGALKHASKTVVRGPGMLGPHRLLTPSKNFGPFLIHSDDLWYQFLDCMKRYTFTPKRPKMGDWIIQQILEEVRKAREKRGTTVFSPRQQDLASAIHVAAKELEELAWPNGGADRAALGATSSIFPLAIVDLLTWFRYGRQEFLPLIVPRGNIQLPLAYERYWQFRAKVKELARPAGPTSGIGGFFLFSRTRSWFLKAVKQIRAYCLTGDTILRRKPK